MSSPAVQPADAPTIGELATRLPELMLRDQQRIGRRLDGARRVRAAEARQKIAAELAADITKAELRLEQRRAAVPADRLPGGAARQSEEGRHPRRHPRPPGGDRGG